jgi:hypothetical protein
VSDLDEEPEVVPVLAISVQVDDVEGVSDVGDPAVLLAARSVHRALDDSSRSLATTFRSYERKTYRWKDTVCEITVARRRSFLHTTLRVASLAAGLLLVGCALAYEHQLSLIRRDLYSISTGGMGAVTICDNGKLRNHVFWEHPLPDSRLTSVRLLRNGKPIARVDGLTEYDDDDGVVHGLHYHYSLDVVDWFGRIVNEQSNRIGTTAMCPGEPFTAPPELRVTPSNGTWDTVFTFVAEPKVNGRSPKLYSWSWKGSQLDPKTNSLYELFAAPTADSRFAHRFTPCDACAWTGKGPDGVGIYYCSADVNVTFADSSVLRYSAQVQVRDMPSLQCRGGVAIPASP